MFSNKTLLITGGTGSFGNAVLNHFLESDIAEIRIFSRDEKKQDDMRNTYRNNKIKYHIGDIRDYNSIYDALNGVDYVFHAAALKQVPSCEFYPMQAYATNVLGAENVIRACLSNRVAKCILLSTDKAVYPVNAMGLSKAMMEKVMISASRTCSTTTTLAATRYGNVMASRGSVIPLFIKQIKAGQPLTITDPNMTRFLMSLAESVDLVLHAFEHASPGDIFVQKAPSCTLKTLASALHELFEIPEKIHLIGTRHGEKLYETLVSKEEMSKASDLGKYYKIPCDNRGLDYDKYFIEGDQTVSDLQDYSSHTTQLLSVEEVKNLLLTLEEVQSEL